MVSSAAARFRGLCMAFRLQHLCLGLVGLSLAGIYLGESYGHSGPQPPPSPPPAPRLIDVNVNRAFDLRWNWLHWWEANRDRYLLTQSQVAARQKAVPANLEAKRAEAVAALRDALKLDHIGLRGASAVGLGRLDDEAATDPLIALVEKDQAEEARRAGVIALGLSATPGAAAFLGSHDFPTAGLREAGIVAHGLFPQLDAATRRKFQTLVDAQPKIATASAWTLGMHAEEENTKWFEQALQRTDSAWLAAEILCGLGRQKDPKALTLLTTVLSTSRDDLDESDLVRLATWRGISKRYEALREMHAAMKAEERIAAARAQNYDENFERYLRQHEAHWAEKDPNRVPAEKQQATLTRTRLVFGREELMFERLRASAAIAVGLLDLPQGEAPLLQLMEERLDEYNGVPKGFAIMSLGEIGGREGVQAIAGVLSTESDRGHLKQQELLEHPMRGYAALALGIYARPEQTNQGPSNRPGTEKILELLGQRLIDTREEVEVRTACALALGLTGRSEVLPLLQRLDDRQATDDPTLAGFLLLARGLLGDRNILEPAAQWFTQADRTDISSIVGSRAAVLALGVLGSEEGIPILTTAWHHNFYVNREVIVALRLCGAYSATDVLIDRLKNAEGAEERQYMAEALGELLKAETAGDLQSLLANNNYTMRNEVLLPYRRLANVFLVDYLIPATGDRDWE